jgi:hypothetical protein
VILTVSDATAASDTAQKLSLTIPWNLPSQIVEGSGAVLKRRRRRSLMRQPHPDRNNPIFVP